MMDPKATIKAMAVCGFAVIIGYGLFGGGAGTGNPIVGLLMIGTTIAGYFLPSVVAWHRNHHQKSAILVLNLAFGWTVIGWIAAMIWANTAVVRRNADGTVG